jgi:hypothetical protein
MNLETLEHYAHVLNKLTKTEEDDSFITGLLYVNKEIINSLQALVVAELCSKSVGLYLDGIHKADKELTEGDFSSTYSKFQIKVNLELTKVNDTFPIYRDWNELLSYHNAVLNPVEAVYIHQDNKLYKNRDGEELFRRYQNASKVCQLIKSVTNEVTAAQEYLIIFGQSLSIKFELNDTALKYDIDPNSLDEMLSQDLHTEARKSLVREALVNLLKDQDTRYRLTYLLTHFNAFATQLLSSYARYVSNYSFDKVRKEYQEKKTEYSARITKVFDDVAVKTFAIPAGVWLAVSKVEEASIPSLEFYKNLVFILIVGVLVIIVSLNLVGQFSTLKALRDEYEGLFARLKNEKASDSADVDEALKELRIKDSNIRCRLLISLILTIVLFFVVFALSLSAIK